MSPEDAQQPQSPGLLPDRDTAEAIVYGDSYSWIKSALWAWDEMEDYLLRKADGLESQILDRRFAFEVLTRNRYAVFAKSPQYNDPRKLQDLLTLRSLLKCVAAARKIQGFREQNRAWARMRGIRRYVESLEGRGVTEQEWKAATSDYNMRPITYESVHGASPGELPEEDIDWDEAMADLMGDDELGSFLDRMMGDDKCLDDMPPDEIRQGSAEPVAEEPEQAGDDVRQDVDGEDDAGEPWPGFREDMGAMFPDPIEEALSAVRRTDNGHPSAADLWDALDIDDRAIIDSLAEGCR